MNTKTPLSNRNLELRKVEIEETKLKLELEKLKVERTKAWTGSLSVVLSVLITGATISLGIWSQYKQAEVQMNIQDAQTKTQQEAQIQNDKSQFELKAAEIVMDTQHPSETLNKAKALQNLFPDRLSENFAESFDPLAYVERSSTKGKRKYKVPSRKLSYQATSGTYQITIGNWRKILQKIKKGPQKALSHQP